MSGAGDRAERLARGAASAGEARDLVRGALLDGGPERSPEDELQPRHSATSYLLSIDAVATRAAGLELEARAERRHAERLLSDFLALAPEARSAAFEVEDPGASWALVELLCERSFAAGPEHPERSRELARWAVELAERGDDDSEADPLRADLRATAWAQLGNAERVSSDLHAAEVALGTARQHLERGTGDPLVGARLLGFASTLRSDQSRFDEAVMLARRAAALYRRAGDEHGHGRTLLKLATFHSYRGELDLALRTLDEAVERLEPDLEPRLLFAVRQNRASYLERAGQLDAAAAELAAAEKLAEASLDRLRLRWLDGRLALRRGDAGAGESTLAAVRSAFIERGLGYEAAQVSLELAILYAEQSRVADQKRLAEQMVSLFAARGVHPEARAALTLYCDAARDEGVSLVLAQRLAEYFERAQGRPWLAFSPSES